MIASMERGADPVHDRVSLTADEVQAIAQLDAQLGPSRRRAGRDRSRLLRWSWALLVIGTVGLVVSLPTSFALAVASSAVWTIGLAGAIADVQHRIVRRRARHRNTRS